MNFLVRARNKAFWLTLVPAVLLLVQVCAAPFGYEWDMVVLNEQLCAIVNAVFALLAILGVAVDPTTSGVGDSERAMGYTVPWKDGPCDPVSAAIEEIERADD